MVLGMDVPPATMMGVKEVMISTGERLLRFRSADWCLVEPFTDPQHAVRGIIWEIWPL